MITQSIKRNCRKSAGTGPVVVVTTPQGSYFCTVCGLEKLGLVDQKWLKRNFSGFLLRTLVVGRRQLSESIEVALDME